MTQDIMLPKDISGFLSRDDVAELKESFSKKILYRDIHKRQRNTDNWFDAYMRYTRGSASPIIYHKWTALSTLAAAVQRKIWWPFDYANIYANMFVFLVGESGSKKGTALNLAKPLMIKAEIAKAPTRLTPEDFFDRMAAQATVFVYEDNPEEVIAKQTAFCVVADELRVFFGGDIDSFVASLTDIFDCREEGDPWHYSTKHHGEASMEMQWLNIIAGTTPDYIKNSLPRHAQNEGFLGRVVLVYSNPVRIKHGLPINMAVKAGLVELKGDLEGFSQERWQAFRNKQQADLAADLKHISHLHGPMDATPEALIAYEEWFQESEERVYTDTLLIKKDKFGGYLTRRSTHLRKAMMLFSLARSDELLITKEDFDAARDLLEATEKYMGRIFTGMPQELGIQEALFRVFKYFWHCAQQGLPITKHKLFQDFLLDMDLDICEKCLTHLMDQVKYIKIKSFDASTGDYVYELTPLGKQKTYKLFSHDQSQRSLGATGPPRNELSPGK